MSVFVKLHLMIISLRSSGKGFSAYQSSNASEQFCVARARVQANCAYDRALAMRVDLPIGC
jgi:hypothetical protein